MGPLCASDNDNCLLPLLLCMLSNENIIFSTLGSMLYCYVIYTPCLLQLKQTKRSKKTSVGELYILLWSFEFSSLRFSIASSSGFPPFRRLFFLSILSFNARQEVDIFSQLIRIFFFQKLYLYSLYCISWINHNSKI